MRNTFLSRFTPSLMPKEVLEEIFVQRERLADRTVRQVRESALTGPPSHTLFVGPRGIGKTHLISLIYHRLKAAEELQGRLAVAWLPEDEGGIASFLDLLIAVLQALMRDDSALASQLAPRLDALYDSRQAESDAKDLLREAVGDRSLLLLAENLDDIFAGLKDAGQKALRAFLQETRFVTLVMTSQGLFSGVSRHNSPFYGFFRVEHLSGLSLTEAVDLLTKIARREKDDSLVSFLQSPAGRARVRAVDHLVAGNPRLYVIFSEFLTRDALDELVPPFLDMLDDLTPYYQAKMRSLSPQQRKIVDFLSGTQGALPVKEIARRTLIGATTAAVQLKALRDSGYVRVAYSQGRETYYELKEPLMRLCLDVKKQRGEPIKLFVEFLRLWCPPEELECRLSDLPGDAPFTRTALREALRLSANGESPSLAACRTDYAQYVKQGDQEQAKQVLEELQALGGQATPEAPLQPTQVKLNKAEQWFNAAEELYNSGWLEEALAAWNQYLALNPKSADAWNSKGASLLRLGRDEEALAAWEQCLALDPKRAATWYNKALALGNLDRTEDALAAYDQCLTLDPQDADAWSNKATVLGNLGRPEEALAASEQCLTLNSQDADAWNNKGAALGELDRDEEALAAWEYCLTLNPKRDNTWYNKGLTLSSLGRFAEALVAYDRCLALNPQDAAAWYNKGVALALLGRLVEALVAYNQGLALSPEDAYTWNNKGVALFRLGRLQSALTAFDHALQIRRDQPSWHTNRTETLFALNRWEEGFTALHNALPLFGDALEDLAEAATYLVRQVLTGGLGQWSARAERFADAYATHNQALALGQALVRGVPGLSSTLFSPDARRLWLETWQSQAGGRSEFTLPLRLLDVAVRFLNSGEPPDPRVLLELNAEERSLLKPLLGFEEAEEDDD